jgi:hypothetical protein
MTREKFIRVTKRILDRTKEGESTAAVAERIADALEMLMDIEGDAPAPEAEPVDWPVVEMEPPKKPPVRAEIVSIPDSPAVIPSSGQPITIYSTRPQTEPSKPQFFSQQEIMDRVKFAIDLFQRATPGKIVVVPDGTNTELSLDRDIVSDVVSGTIKITYSLSGQVAPSPSDPYKTEPMSIDRIAYEVVSVLEDPLPSPDDLMVKIRQRAREVFRAGPKEIRSSTPVRTGSLRFDSSSPHTEV